MRDKSVFKGVELEGWEHIEGIEGWTKHETEINGQRLYARCPA